MPVEESASTEDSSNPGRKTAHSKGGELKGRTMGFVFFSVERDSWDFALSDSHCDD